MDVPKREAQIHAHTLADLRRPVDRAVLRRLRQRRSYSPIVEFDLLLAVLPDQLLTPTGAR